MSDFRSYSGEEFFSATFPKRDFLVENILREKDSVIVVGGPKTGKSILLFQLICSLTSQHPFLDKYEVKRPCTVSYVQLEGEIADYQDRMIRMAQALEVNPANLNYIYSSPLNLTDPLEGNRLCETIGKYHKKLDVLIIDPLYFAFQGSLSDDAIVRRFLGNIRVIKDFLGCAVIIVHHTHKVRFDSGSGLVIDEGDAASFGSVFFHAWPDHILLLTSNSNTGLRSLTCGTQRSGAIVSSETLRLVQPAPLYFEPTATPATALKPIELLDYLKKSGPSTYAEIKAGMGMSSSTFYFTVKPLIIQKLVIKDISGKLTKYLSSV